MVTIWSNCIPGRPSLWKRPWGFQESSAAHSSRRDDSSAVMDSTVETALHACWRALHGQERGAEIKAGSAQAVGAKISRYG
jgi:hypothetical protein